MPAYDLIGSSHIRMLLVPVTENPTQSGPENQNNIYVISYKEKNKGRMTLRLVGLEAQHHQKPRFFPLFLPCHSQKDGLAFRRALFRGHKKAAEALSSTFADGKPQGKMKYLF